jgi:hypothetical protein
VHAIHVRVTVNDRDTAVRGLQEEVVPNVSAAPGFVAGYWVALPNGKGTSIIVFDSEASAQAVSGGLGQSRDGVTIDSVEVGEVVAHA